MLENEEKFDREEKIYVMSDYLKTRKTTKVHSSFIVKTDAKKNKKSFPLWLIWIFFGFVIIAFAAIFYFNPNLVISLLGGNINTQGLTEKSQSVITNQGVENLQQLVFEEKTIKAELKEGDNIIVGVELFLPENSLAVGEEITLDGRFVINEKDNNYQVIGGLFEIFPLVVPKQNLTLKIFYNEAQIDSNWENDLKIGYQQDNFWTILPTEIDLMKNILTAQLSSLYNGVFAAVISSEKILHSQIGREITSGVFLGQDSDNDALTDIEEQIYGTNSFNTDTDSDSISDGAEIINLYSPVSGYGVKLEDTDLIKVYQNKTFKYSLFYPNSFSIRIIQGSDDSEIIISGDGGEFFSVVVQDNMEGLSAKEWYQQQISGINGRELEETAINNYPAIWSVNNLTVYVAKDNWIYALTHNIGGVATTDLRTTFLMILKSFKFID